MMMVIKALRRGFICARRWGIPLRATNQNLTFKKEAVQKSFLLGNNIFCFVIFKLLSKAEMEGATAPIPGKKNGSNENDLTPQAAAVVKADELFLIGKFKESHLVLTPFKESDNVEILWRLSRALYNMSKEKGLNKDDKEAYIIEAYEYVDKALRLADGHFAVHKWMAILADAKSSLQGIKARITTLPVFKKHLMLAIELNPKDATSIYMLGQYTYNIADMSWMQLTIAKTLFGAIPEASFEEAFTYFSRAEEVEPNFYSANLLMLGKTCLKLKRIEAAHFWLKCATSYPVRTDEDEAVRLEAEELLKKNPAVKKEVKSKEEQNM